MQIWGFSPKLKSEWKQCRSQWDGSLLCELLDLQFAHASVLVKRLKNISLVTTSSSGANSMFTDIKPIAFID